MSDSRLQEIVSLAVVGRAERRITWCHTIGADGFTNVLGVRVSGTSLSVTEEKSDPKVSIKVSLDLWCSHGDETGVVRTVANCTQTVPVKLIGQVMGDRDVRAVLLSAARSTGVKIQNGQVSLTLEADVALEVTGLTRMWIRAYNIDDDGLEDLDGTDDSSGSSGSGSGSISTSPSTSFAHAGGE